MVAKLAVQGERVEVYRTQSAQDDQQWAWRYFDANGEEISRSSEGYANRGYAVAQAGERNPGVTVYVQKTCCGGGWSQIR